jgi:thioredoxin-like negative regulator of GroEL
MLRQLIFMVAIMLAPTSIFAQEIFKSVSFDEARLIAQKERKTIVIDFYTTWCGPCKQLDKTTWQDKNVVKFFTDSAIALKIDAEAQADLARKFRIKAYPTIVFVKADGDEIDRVVGYLDAAQFLDTAKSAIAGKSILTHTKEAFEQDKGNIKFGRAYKDALLAKGLNKEALEVYKVLISNNKDDVGFRMGYINFLFQENQFREAIAEYEDLIRVISNNKNPILPLIKKEYARRLVQVGQYKEALEQYMDCYEHGAEENASFGDMRFYLIEFVGVLADKYSPAKQALIERRNPLRQAILDGKATTEQVRHYISLNNALKDTSNTLEVFDNVKSQPEIRKILFSEVLDALLQAKRYGDVLAMAPDLLAEVKSSINDGQSSIDNIKNDPNMDKRFVDDEISIVRMHVVSLNSGYYEAALGVNNVILASQIADKLIDFHNGIDIYNALIERAKHVNANQQVIELKKRADKSLLNNESSAN